MFLSQKPLPRKFFSSNLEGREPREIIYTSLHEYGKEENIPLLTPGIWQVHRGIVQLSKINLKGEKVILGWLTAGMAFGVWLPSLPTYRAQTLCDTILGWIGTSEIETASVTTTHSLFTQLNRHRQQTETLLAIAGLPRVAERLEQLLLLLKRDLGQPVAQGTRLMVRITHQDLATAIGSSRVTVTRILGEFQTNGFVIVDRQRHLIVKEQGISSIF